MSKSLCIRGERVSRRLFQSLLLGALFLCPLAAAQDAWRTPETAEFSGASPESEESFVSEPPKRTVLNRLQRKRLRRAKALLLKRAKKLREELKEEHFGDVRGEPEVTVCSLNLDNYGLKKDVGTLLGRRASKRLKRKEKSFVKVVVEVDCDVVALQGVLGDGYGRARAAAERLAKKLKKASKQDWSFFVGGSVHKSSHQAYLVKEENVRAISTFAHSDKRLPWFSPFVLNKFTRTPYEIRLAVKGKGKARSKNLYLLNIDFRQNVKAKEREPEIKKMQQAEGIRQLVELQLSKFTSDTPPILLVLGERDSVLGSASAELLEGSIHLRDFKKSQAVCELNENGFAKCPEKHGYPALLFGLFSSNVNKIKKPIRVIREGETKYYSRKSNKREDFFQKKQLLERSTDIYMIQPDLIYASEHYQYPNQFAVGTADVKKGLAHSPLVWVKLNW